MPRSLRSLLVVLITTAATTVLAGAAPAQTGTPAAPVLTGAVTPTKGGSARKPAPATVRLSVKTIAPSRTVGRVTFRLPANLRLSGKDLPACPAAQIAELGEGGCPEV